MTSSPLIFDVGDAVKVENGIEIGYLERFDKGNGWLVHDEHNEHPRYQYVPPTMLLRATFRKPLDDKPFLVPNKFSATWKQPLSISFECELAKTSKVRCSKCKHLIVKGKPKLGKKTIMYVYNNKGITSTVCWYHIQCFPILENNFSSSKEFDLPLPILYKRRLEVRIKQANKKWYGIGIRHFCSEKVVNRSTQMEQVDMIVEDHHLEFSIPKLVADAARNAVARQILSYKKKLFRDTDELDCPVSGKKMELASCHIHHQYPYSFNDIVKLYLLKTGKQIGDLSVTDFEFRDFQVRQSFAEFHKIHARLLAVHPEANLSRLKKYFNQGKCDLCSSFEWDLSYFPEFERVLCYACNFSTFMCKQECIQIFGLSASELDELNHIERPNKISINFAPMKLYLADEVMNLAIKKYGSKDGVYAMQRNREAKRKNRKLLADRRKGAATPLTRNLRKRAAIPLSAAEVERARAKEEKTAFFQERKQRRFENLIYRFECL